MPSPLESPNNVPRPANLLLGEAIADLQLAYEAMQAGAIYPGIPTGLPTLDKHFGGMQEGIFLLGAMPGMGKTRMALSIALNAAKEGFPVLYLTADEGARRLALKLACMDAGIKLSDLSTGSDPTILQTYKSTDAEILKRVSFFEVKDINVDSIQQHLADRIKQAGSRMGLLVVDYVQALAANYPKEMRQAVGTITVNIREAAIACRSPALVISALSRGGYGLNPTMASLRESSDLEYSADGVWLLSEDINRPVSSPMQALTLRVEKNRWGAANLDIPIAVNAALSTMTEYK
jgi:replicative DNA helicase